MEEGETEEIKEVEKAEEMWERRRRRGWGWGWSR
jgi:hypothetical protein